MNNKEHNLKPFTFHSRITRADFNVTPEHTLTPRQVARVERFMRFHNPPPHDAAIRAIIVPGTSPSIDAESFVMRTDATSVYADLFPEASIVVSGMRPDISRATAEEMAPGYSEAKVVKEAVVERGVDPQRITLEEEAKHTGENIVNSLNILFGTEDREPMLDGNNPRSLLIVCSSYFGRRIDLYMKRELRERGLSDRVTYFIYDADVQEDFDRENGPEPTPLSSEALERKKVHLFREARRVSLYRDQDQI